MKRPPDRDGRKERGAVTRTRIIQAAITLIARDGIKGVTGSTLAKGAGVSKATIFHHFPSIQAVPLAALDHIVQGLVAEVQHHTTARGYLLQAGLDVLRLTAERADVALAMNALLTGARQNPELEQRMAQLSTLQRDAMAEELARLAPNTTRERAGVVADITVTAVDGLATHLILSGERQRLERAWEQLVPALLVMLEAPEANQEPDPSLQSGGSR